MKKIVLMAVMLLSLTGMKAQQVSGLYEELPNPVATDAGNSLLYRTSVLPHAMIGLVTFVHLEASVATGFGSSS